MKSLKNNTDYYISKYVLTVIALLSIVIGFFMGKVSPEIFYATVGAILSHFYQDTTIKNLSSKIKAQSEEIKILKDGN
jgi:hypothetical protein